MRLLLLIAIILMAMSATAMAQTVSHAAEQIKPGMFGKDYAGNWIFMNGSVGIGTTDLGGAKLKVIGNVSGSIFVDSDSPSWYIDAGGTSNINNLGVGGSVGIGTTPSYKLDVYGSAGNMVHFSSDYTTTGLFFNIQPYNTWTYINWVGSGGLDIRGTNSATGNLAGALTISPSTPAVSIYTGPAGGHGTYERLRFTPFGAYFPYLEAGAGTHYLMWNSGTFAITYSSSSLRYKQNISDYNIDVSKINQLKPRKFVWNNKTVTAGKQDFGLIAEEVYDVFPEIVSLNNESLPDNVDYAKLSVILLKGYQEQQKQIDALKAIVCKDHPAESLCK